MVPNNVDEGPQAPALASCRAQKDQAFHYIKSTLLNFIETNVSGEFSQASQASRKGRRAFWRWHDALSQALGSHKNDPDYPEYVSTVVARALDDCDLSFADIEAASVGSYFHGMGQRALLMGMDGIPINVATLVPQDQFFSMMRNFVAGGMKRRLSGSST